MSPVLLKQMVDRFLSWKLPIDFAPDCGIRFTPLGPADAPGGYWPNGTNLLNANQAEAMILHILNQTKGPESRPEPRRFIPRDNFVG